MEKSSQPLQPKKKDFSSQSLKMELIKKQIEDLKDRDTSIPVTLILQVEFEDYTDGTSNFFMIAYLEYTGKDKAIKFEKINSGSIVATGDTAPLPTPIGLGNIRIPSDTLLKWVEKPGDVILKPVIYKNPHLGYTDTTGTSYFPSPPAPSTSASAGA